jgi:hypothetical protein
MTNRCFLYMRMIVFTIFCFLVDEKIKLKVLACYFELLTYFEILLVTRFKDPTAGGIGLLKSLKIPAQVMSTCNI